jgi:glutamate synthase (NADPH/NADH) small chain
VGVTVCALEDREHFLADPDEVRESLEEDIEIQDSRGPLECLVENGRLVGLRTQRVISIFDEQQRFAPKYDAGDTRQHTADMIVEAIGQSADTSLLGEELTEALEWNRGRLRVDADGRSSEPWLWAAGDMVNGPDVVHAVADGHRCARSIDRYLAQMPVAEGPS